MPDSVDTLSNATGIPRQTMLEIWEEVKRNQARLDGCSRHLFTCMDVPRKLGSKFQCSRCGGKIDGSAMHWYSKGIEHASGR